MDRAALDAAIFLDLEHGGWCPRNRRAEDGPIDAVYQLKETTDASYSVRTEQNVVDSDGTLILCTGKLTGGTKLTANLAAKHRRPCLVLDLISQTQEQLYSHFFDWLCEENIGVLNVAGPRESTAPGIGQLAERFLISALENDCPN